MSEFIKIAVDAMGGDDSPQKIVDGIIHNHNLNKDNYFKIFGNEIEIKKLINDRINNKYYEIVNTTEEVKSTDSPLEAAKRGKNTSMWLSIESVKKKETDIVISAGNTGALLVIAKLNLKMIENIDKPALSALWPNKKGMSVVLDLGANIDCSAKNLVDFSIMGASLYKSLYPSQTPNVALLNIGSEELKGIDANWLIKELNTKVDQKNIEIVSGCNCKGADKLGIQYAIEKGFNLIKFTAEWNKFGKAAGPIRNKEMAVFADVLIAFWDGRSRGTQNMIRLANKKGLRIKVVVF